MPRMLPVSQKGVFSDCKGISLIEILVSFGVLLLLVLLVAAAVRPAVRWSQTVTCASNLRRFHAAFILYAQENQGHLPPYRHFNWPRADGTYGNGPDWRQVLEDYLPEEPKPRRNSLDRPSMDVCPAATFRSSNSYTNYYALNANSTHANPIHVPSVEYPSLHFILGESGGQMRITYARFASEMQFRHGDKANLLFLDGRVERFEERQIPVSGSVEYNAFWLGR